MTSERRDGVTMISVEPFSGFGGGHGALIVFASFRPDLVIIAEAARMVYIPDEWMNLVIAGGVPWAEYVHDEPWVMGGTLKISGATRKVIYQVTGGCGPRVKAYLCEQPD